MNGSFLETIVVTSQKGGSMSVGRMKHHSAPMCRLRGLQMATPLWQNAALLGAVYGQVDFLIDCEGLGEVRGQKSEVRVRKIKDRPALALSSGF